MSQSHRLRSLLFVPADAPRKLERAFSSEADVVIADLEDAVAPSQKQSGRDVLLRFVESTAPRRWAVRINGLGTAEYLDDLIAVVPCAPDYIMLPKCEGPGDLRELALQLTVLEHAAGLSKGRIGLLPLVTETALSLQNLSYRGVCERLRALVFGAEDLSADLGVTPRKADGTMTSLIAQARRSTVIAAAAAGVPAIDTPLPDYRDEDAMRREATEAAALGFGGKLCIHPAQIASVHKVLAPSAEKLDWACLVIAAFEAAPENGVCVVHGAMVDKAHLKLAHKIQSLDPNHD